MTSPRLVAAFPRPAKFLFIAVSFLKISFWEYSFIMNKHNQKPTDMFHKRDFTVNLAYIKILKYLNILNFRVHILEAIFTLKMTSGM